MWELNDVEVAGSDADDIGDAEDIGDNGDSDDNGDENDDGDDESGDNDGGDYGVLLANRSQK